MPNAHNVAVRLTDKERAGILRAVERSSADVGAVWNKIVLFGSRVDLSARGGDIDLCIVVDTKKPRYATRLRMALEDELGAQKFDIVLDDGSGDDPFVESARDKGVVLWIND